ELEPEADVLAAVEAAPSTVALEPGPRGRRNGNGRSAVVERPSSVLEEPPFAAPSAVAPTAGTPVAEPTLGEWLNRRWLYGLTYWQVIALGFLGVTLFLTRFYNLGDRAMHHDESMHAKFAWDTYKGQVYKYNPLLHGPFQFLSVAGSMWLFGATEATARAVPAIFGVGLVGLTFLWRRWLGTVGWLLALAIFIFSPSFTYFSRMLREDSYTATWTLLAATGFVGYVLHRRRPWFYAFCAGIAFTWATKETVFITGFIFATYMAVSFIWEHVGRTERRMLAGLCAGGLVAAFFSAVVGVLGKGTPREVGGALIGGLIGAGLGYLYDVMRRSDDRLAPRNSSRVVPARVAGARRRAGSTGPTGRFNRELDRPQGPFTRAVTTLWNDKDGFWGYGTFWGGVIIFAVIFVVLFSSLFTNVSGNPAPRTTFDIPGWFRWLLGIFQLGAPMQQGVTRGGIMEGLIGGIIYWLEQHGVQRGNQPWYYYLLLLGAYETLAWLFGIAGTVYYLRPNKGTWLTSFLIWWWVVALVIYSWAGEKMPWLIIHIATPLVLLTARYLGELLTSATRHVWEKRTAIGALALLSIWTIHTGWPVNFERPDTPKDLLVYTQTAPDVKKVMEDIHRISLEQTNDAYGAGVVVQSGTWWPFSWYLRDFKNAEYPANLSAQATKPIVLIAAEDLEKNRPFLQGYTGTKYKMRWWYPEDYRSLGNMSFFGFLGHLTKPDVRDGLWKWLIYRETTQPLGSYDFYLYLKDGIGAATAGSAAGSTPTQAAGAAVNPLVYESKRVEPAVISQWGTNGRNPGQLNTPRGVAVDAQGNVYVADTLNHRIQKFSRTGQPLGQWGSEGSADGQFKEPMGVAVDTQGNIYVADTWNHRIQKLGPDGRFLLKWNGQPSFWGPRAVALDGSNNVYVMDTGNKRIQKFDADGRFLATFGAEGAGPGQFREPIGLAVASDGRMFVADTNNKRIQQLDATGRMVAEWPLAGWQGGTRNEPYLALDAAGNVLVTDPPGSRILKFSPTGEPLAVGGVAGRGNGQFDLPLGIAVGDAIYVADSGNHRIQALTLPG
ncbi:MAG TPA: flippase activity-associated protein Agl23, partial [Chloroflexota bacterium]|nr:flippase activity-associated protein Agl23 [Chloroflexota bacterium]